MADWKRVGKKAGKAYLTGGLSIAADARKKRASALKGETVEQEPTRDPAVGIRP
jgi:hypothetical protein